MNPKCSANVVSMVCHSFFKECKQVERRQNQVVSQVWLPSLLCRSECDQHFALWNACLKNIEGDAKAKGAFDGAMQSLVS
jgi:hypothetical protein